MPEPQPRRRWREGMSLMKAPGTGAGMWPDPDHAARSPSSRARWLSRASLHYFKHNDMADLERILQAIEVQERKDRKPLTRRMIVVEGIYSNTGELAPLTQLLALKNKYKKQSHVQFSYDSGRFQRSAIWLLHVPGCWWRRANSFGVLGKTGRGATEHWGVDPGQVAASTGCMGCKGGGAGGGGGGQGEGQGHEGEGQGEGEGGRGMGMILLLAQRPLPLQQLLLLLPPLQHLLLLLPLLPLLLQLLAVDVDVRGPLNLAWLQVDVVVRLPGHSLGSVGGFCVGTEEPPLTPLPPLPPWPGPPGHRPWSTSASAAAGYCFSASLPPYLAVAASSALATLKTSGAPLLARLRSNAGALRRELRQLAACTPAYLACPAAFKLVEGPGTEVSPLIHLHLAQAPKDRAAAQALLQRIADHALHVSGEAKAQGTHRRADVGSCGSSRCGSGWRRASTRVVCDVRPPWVWATGGTSCLQKSGVLVAVPQYAAIERTKPRPSIRLCCSSALEDADITAVASALKAAAKSILG
ncbi:hypothetical protein QJQ45_027164 [Haematococcus lacustris]|nr:hypothetical protein QJQ45_027164 [Haematococcus lacustris]